MTAQTFKKTSSPGVEDTHEEKDQPYNPLGIPPLDHVVLTCRASAVQPNNTQKAWVTFPVCKTQEKSWTKCCYSWFIINVGCVYCTEQNRFQLSFTQTWEKNRCFWASLIKTANEPKIHNDRWLETGWKQWILYCNIIYYDMICHIIRDSCSVGATFHKHKI